MAEEKTVVKKAWKDSLPAKWAKVLAGSGAAIGASAIITVLLKQGDLSGIKGLKRLAIPLGIFGIATFASQSAQKAVEAEINDDLDTIESVAELLGFLRDHNITNISMSPTDDGKVVVDIDGD